MTKNIRIEIMINTSESDALNLYDKIIEFVESEFPEGAGYSIIDTENDIELD